MSGSDGRRVAFVTGAAGLLGGACTDRLTREGWRVVALVRDRRPGAALPAGAVEVRGDFEQAGRAIRQYRPSLVLHLGAQSQVGAGFLDPAETFEANVRGTWLVLEACRSLPAGGRPEAVIVASSDKAYGPSDAAYTEATPLRPRGPYDTSKAAADLIARSYAASFGLPVVVTRCGNLYGPGDRNPDRLIPHVAARLARGLPPLLRGTGAMSREWLYVDDAAAAALLLADRARELAGCAFNVGGGERATVKQIVERLVAVAAESAGTDGPDAPAPPAPLYSAGEPDGEIQHQSLDSSALYGLGWKPRVGLDEGLRRTFDWYRSHPGVLA